MAIVDYKTGKIKTTRQLKAEVLKATSWTSKQYENEYDKFRNKLRAYESVSGLPKQKANELFYEQQKAKAKFGTHYRPSQLFRNIELMPSQSSGKSKVSGVSKEIERTLKQKVLADFKPLLKKSEEAKAVLKEWKNSQRRKDVSKHQSVKDLLQGLSKVADDLHASQKGKAATFNERNNTKLSYRQMGTP